MKMQVSKNKGRTILMAGTILTVLFLTVSISIAGETGGIEGHVEHIANDLCAMGSSVRRIAYAVIGLFVVNLISLIVSIIKKTK